MTPTAPQSKPIALSGTEITGSKMSTAATEPSVAAAKPVSITGDGGGGNSFIVWLLDGEPAAF
jgi:hypothetical protein